MASVTNGAAGGSGAAIGVSVNIGVSKSQSQRTERMQTERVASISLPPALK